MNKLFALGLCGLGALMVSGVVSASGNSNTCTSQNNQSYQNYQNNSVLNWENSNYWDCGHVPTSSDNVIINQDISFTSCTAKVAKTLTINSGHVLTDSCSAGATLTVAGSFTNNGTIKSANSSSSLIVNGDFVHNGNASTSQFKKLKVVGSFTNNGLIKGSALEVDTDCKNYGELQGDDIDVHGNLTTTSSGSCTSNSKLVSNNTLLVRGNFTHSSTRSSNGVPDNTFKSLVVYGDFQNDGVIKGITGSRLEVDNDYKNNGEMQGDDVDVHGNLTNAGTRTCIPSGTSSGSKLVSNNTLLVRGGFINCSARSTNGTPDNTFNSLVVNGTLQNDGAIKGASGGKVEVDGDFNNTGRFAMSGRTGVLKDSDTTDVIVVKQSFRNTDPNSNSCAVSKTGSATLESTNKVKVTVQGDFKNTSTAAKSMVCTGCVSVVSGGTTAGGSTVMTNANATVIGCTGSQFNCVPSIFVYHGKRGR